MVLIGHLIPPSTKSATGVNGERWGGEVTEEWEEMRVTIQGGDRVTELKSTNEDER